MLMGILLVSYSSRGHQLVFSYPEITNNTFAGFDTSFLADILSPKTQLCDKKFHLRVNEVDFIGHPTLLNVDRPGTGLIYSRRVQKSLLKNTKLSALTMFHLVFAMGNCGKNELKLIYEYVLLPLTNGFKFEQLRRGFIREQTELILQLKDQYRQNNILEPIKVTNDSIVNPWNTCSLAQTLIHVYRLFQNENITNIVSINNSVSLSIQTDLKKMKARSEPIIPGTFKTTFPSLRPYHTILLLKDPEQIMILLPRDASPILIQLIQSVTPTSSFEQLQTTLNCTLSQIYRYASHLHYWGLAKIVQTISARNFYVVNDKANLNNLNNLAIEFNNRFGPLELTKILGSISIPKPYHSAIPNKEQRNLYLEAIAFLLQHNLVVQVHMHLLLMIPSNIVSKVSHSESIEIMIQDPNNACPFERECISLLVQSQHNPFIRNTFERLIKYMNGKYPLDEITFQENLTRYYRFKNRKELKLILGHFRDEIITTLHQ